MLFRRNYSHSQVFYGFLSIKIYLLEDHFISYIKMDMRGFLLLLILNITKINAIETMWIRSVIHEITNLSPYHIALVSNKIKTTTIYEATEEISTSTPTISFNLEEMRVIAENMSLADSAFVRSGKTAFYCIFYDFCVNCKGENSYENDLPNFFYYFDKLSPSGTRPKCLIKMFFRKMYSNLFSTTLGR